MKSFITLFSSTLVLFSAFSASAARSATVQSYTVNSLNCSGAGSANGYTTISLTSGTNRISVSSAVAAGVISDTNASIKNVQLLANQHIELTIHSPKFNSDFKLDLSGAVGPAEFITGGGTDVITCSSNIAVNAKAD